MERENELYAFSFDECLPAEKTPQGLKACDERGEIYKGGKRKGRGVDVELGEEEECNEGMAEMDEENGKEKHRGK
jgi:hypothetical protein